MVSKQYCNLTSYGQVLASPNSERKALYIPVHQNGNIMTNSTTHTHTHPFNGPLSGTTRVSQYQKGETNLDFTEARDSEWQWHQLGHMQVCTSLQTDNHTSTPPLSFFTGRMPFLPPNQQCQSKHWRRMTNSTSLAIVIWIWRWQVPKNYIFHAL